MMATSRERVLLFAAESIAMAPALGSQCFAGRTLLHWACAAGALPVVEQLLRLGTPADLLDRGRHTPLYSVANECASANAPELVRVLVQAGADVNACAGVTRATPLHMAARRGHVETARALLECGAQRDARDSQGDTPLQRAINRRQLRVVELLKSVGAEPTP